MEHILIGGPTAVEHLLDLLDRARAKAKDFVIFALGMLTALRNNMLDEITALIDAGGTGGLIRIYDGTRPATGGTATTLLAELVASATSSPAAASGVLTFSTITDDSSANATGTLTWYRIVDSTGTFVYDGTAGTSGTDLVMDSASITSGQVISISSMTITAGNA